MFDNISNLPELPENLIEAYNREQLIIFLGAGISRLAGCESWAGLAYKLVQELLNNDLIDYKTSIQLLELNENKKIITIAFGIFEENNRVEAFFNCFDKSLEGTGDAEIYELLSTINCLYATTNADLLLDRAFFGDDKDLINAHSNYDVSRISSDKFRSPSIFHIHGRKDNRDSLVFTTSKYLEVYNNQNFQNFLRMLFEKYTVLFLGYGLNEFELLDYLIGKSGYDGRPLKHFYLEGYFSYEIEFAKHMSGYFSKLGIELIPYSKDIKGYKQQKSIIKNWANEFNEKSIVLANELAQIDRLLSNYTKIHYQQVRYLIELHESCRSRFFEKVLDAPQFLDWIRAMEENSIFSISNAPVIKMVDDKSYKAKRWDELEIIVNALEEEFSADQYLNQLAAKILMEASKELIDSEEHIKNWTLIESLWHLLMLLEEELLLPEMFAFFKNVFDKKYTNFISFGDHIYRYKPYEKYSINQYPYLYSFMLNFRIVNNEIIPVCETYLLDSIYSEIEKTVNRNNAWNLFKIIDPIVNRILNVEEYFVVSDWKSIDLFDSEQQYYSSSYLYYLLKLYVKSVMKMSSADRQGIVDAWLLSDEAFYRVGAIYLIGQKYTKLKKKIFELEKNIFNDQQVQTQLLAIIKHNNGNITSQDANKFSQLIEKASFGVREDIEEDEYHKYINFYRLMFLRHLAEKSSATKRVYLRTSKLEHYDFQDIDEVVINNFSGWKSGVLENEKYFDDKINEVSSVELNKYIAEYIAQHELDEWNASIAGSEIVEYMQSHKGSIEKLDIILEGQDFLLLACVIDEYSRMIEKLRVNERRSVTKFCTEKLLYAMENLNMEFSEKLMYSTTSFINYETEKSKNLTHIEANIKFIIEVLERMDIADSKDEIYYNGREDRYEFLVLRTLLVGIKKLKVANRGNRIADKMFSVFRDKLDSDHRNDIVRTFISSRVQEFLYINYDETLDILNKVFWINNQELSIAAATGYSFFNSTLYKEVYLFFKQTNLIKRVLLHQEIAEEKFDFRKRYIKQYILALLVGFDMNKDLLEYILENTQYTMYALKMLTNKKFFASRKDNLTQLQKTANDIWCAIHKHAVENSYPAEIFISLIRFIVVNEQFNQVFEEKYLTCFRFITTFARVNVNSIIIRLLEIIKGNESFVIDCCKVIIPKCVYIPRQMDEIVIALDSGGFHKEAVSICNIGAKHGFNSFAKLLEKIAKKDFD